MKNIADICGYGGIGRRAGFRVQCPRRAGSSPVIRTKGSIRNTDAPFFSYSLLKNNLQIA